MGKEHRIIGGHWATHTFSAKGAIGPALEANDILHSRLVRVIAQGLGRVDDTSKWQEQENDAWWDY